MLSLLSCCCGGKGKYEGYENNKPKERKSKKKKFGKKKTKDSREDENLMKPSFDQPPKLIGVVDQVVSTSDDSNNINNNNNATNANNTNNNNFNINNTNNNNNSLQKVIDIPVINIHPYNNNNNNNTETSNNVNNNNNNNNDKNSFEAYYKNNLNNNNAINNNNNAINKNNNAINNNNNAINNNNNAINNNNNNKEGQFKTANNNNENAIKDDEEEEEEEEEGGGGGDDNDSYLTDSDLNISEAIFVTEVGPYVSAGTLNRSRNLTDIAPFQPTHFNEKSLETDLLERSSFSDRNRKHLPRDVTSASAILDFSPADGAITKSGGGGGVTTPSVFA